jgi:cobalt-zinc-cadmium efflux system outer membrane protein
VLAGRERLAAGDAGVSLEQRMLLRDVNAVFGVKAMSGMNSMVAGFTLPIPLLDQNRGGRARAKAEREAAAFDVAAVQRGARADILGAEEAARVLTLRAMCWLRAMQPAPSRVSAACQCGAVHCPGCISGGAVSLLQVLDASRAWSDARVTYFRTLFAQHEAVIALILARGDELSTALPLLMPASTRGTTR